MPKKKKELNQDVHFHADTVRDALESIMTDFSAAKNATLDPIALKKYERLVEVLLKLCDPSELTIDDPKERLATHCITLKSVNPFYVECNSVKMDLFREALNNTESFECYNYPNNVLAAVTFSVTLYKEPEDYKETYGAKLP